MKRILFQKENVTLSQLETPTRVQNMTSLIGTKSEITIWIAHNFRTQFVSTRALFSCGVKVQDWGLNFKSKIWGIFDLIIFGQSPVKMPLIFQNWSRDVKLESLVRFDFQIRAFLTSRDQFEKFIGHFYWRWTENNWIEYVRYYMS